MTNGLVLSVPTKADKKDVLTYRDEFAGHNEKGDIPGASGLVAASSYGNWLRRVSEFSDESTVPEGFVPATTYLARSASDQQLVGILQIRHALNEHLLHEGGHIGYSVGSRFRRQGYATEMLRLALQKCTTLGLRQVLITCDDDNVGSRKVIEANGGVLENIVDTAATRKRRYWIVLS